MIHIQKNKEVLQINNKMTSNSFFKWAKNFGWTLQKMRSYDHKVYEKVLNAMANANHTHNEILDWKTSKNKNCTYRIS